MRHSIRALVGVVLVGCCCREVLAADEGSRWWPFGRYRDAEVSQSSDPQYTASNSSSASAAQQSSAPYPMTSQEQERRWMIKSPFANVSWPSVHLPEMPKPTLPPPLWPEKSEVDAARNAWVEQNPDPEKASPLQAMTDGARRVRQSTRTAWDKTVDVFMQTDQSNSGSSRVARREGPSLWQRMFGAEEQKSQGPQTVTEWMAQDRLDP